MLVWCKFNKFLCYIFKFNYCKLLRGEKTTNGWANFLLNTKYKGEGIPGEEQTWDRTSSLHNVEKIFQLFPPPAVFPLYVGLSQFDLNI